jgi:hypothetical protein
MDSHCGLYVAMFCLHFLNQSTTVPRFKTLLGRARNELKRLPVC